MLDFKNFKKVAEDDKTATMRHPKGHEIRVILKGLRPIEREQLKRIKMADAGSVSDAAADQNVPETPDSSAPVDPNASLQSAEPAPVSVPQVPATPNVLNPDGQLNPGATAQTSQAAIDLGQKIDTESAKARVDYEHQAAQERQRLNNLDIEHAQSFEKNANATIQAMKDGIINPDQYNQSQSDQQKIATGIGLFLGGMGGQGHSNLALDFLNKQIDRNIEAQKQNYEHQQNIYGAYKDLYGNENIATGLSKVAMKDMLAHQIEQTAAQMGTPIAAQKAMQFKAQTAVERSKQFRDSVLDLKDVPGYTGASGQEPTPGPPASVEPSGKKESFGPESADSRGIYNIQPILKPDAKQRFDQEAWRATYNPSAAAQLPRLQEQYAKASRADQIIGRAKELFSSLYENATPGGWTGRLAQHANLESVPIVGGALQGASQFVGEGITGARKALGQNNGDEFSQNRRYETSKQELSDLLRSVFPGIGGGELNSKLNGIVPDEQDSPGDITKKMKAFEDLVKTSGEFNVLEDKKLANPTH